MSSELAIRARKLSKAYPIYRRPSDRLKQMLSRGRWGRPRQFWAVRDVDLELRRGETVGIVGRNGSGKSTLLEMISGTLEPTAGELEVDGRVAALLELGAGFNPEFTGWENARVNAAILGLDPDEVNEQLGDIVAFADVGEFIHQPVKTYSSGMYARLAFAVAIHSVPEILVVDEILSVGDEAFQRKCFARIEAIRKGGGTILFVSHTAASILELCDRAVLLDAGELLLLGTPKTVVTAYQRLLYAPPEAAAAVREEIRGQGGARGGASRDEPEVPQGAGREGITAEADDPAYFDPLLESKSTLRYDVHGAEIRNPMILTRSGVQVNCLSAHQRYVLRYEVHFEKDAFDVHYHTLLKTVSGLELGGGTHPSIGTPGGDASAGTVVSVEFEFSCSLNPGVYLLNCGVTGCGGQQLHRIVDALAFRILPIATATTFGHVNFAHCASIVGER